MKLVRPPVNASKVAEERKALYALLASFFEERKKSIARRVAEVYSKHRPANE